jgi:uncharacterized protein with beta-barrel porin domain
MEDLALAKKTLRTAANGLDSLGRMIGLIPHCLQLIPDKVAEFEAAPSPEAEAVSAAEHVSEELVPLAQRLRDAAAASTESLSAQFEAAKAALQEKDS